MHTIEFFVKKKLENLNRQHERTGLKRNVQKCIKISEISFFRFVDAVVRLEPDNVKMQAKSGFLRKNVEVNR